MTVQLQVPIFELHKSLPFIVTSILGGILVVVGLVLCYRIVKKNKFKSSNVTNVRPNGRSRKPKPYIGKGKKKMAGKVKLQVKGQSKKSPSLGSSTNGEPPSVTYEQLEISVGPTLTQTLKRRSIEEEKDISNSSPSKRLSPGPKKMQETRDFSHPVYKKISSRNGEINRMNHDQLKSALNQFNLDPCGYPDILRKRLKLHYSKTSIDKAGLDSHQTVQNYDYLCIIDFEATCEYQNPADYLHEIIEFPIILVNTRTRLVEDTFMMFCKPLLNPKLTEFCTQLTSITQTQVDHADSFPIVLERVNQWLKEKDLGSKYKFAIVTDGPWDMNLFLRVQCKLSNVKFPSYANKWINLSKTFSTFYKTSRVKLELMLKSLGMEFEGRPHRGIDDAKNIAKIAVQLMEDGCNLVINDALN